MCICHYKEPWPEKRGRRPQSGRGGRRGRAATIAAAIDVDGIADPDCLGVTQPCLLTEQLIKSRGNMTFAAGDEHWRGVLQGGMVAQLPRLQGPGNPRSTAVEGNHTAKMGMI